MRNDRGLPNFFGANAELERLIYKAITLTWNEVYLDDLEARHHLKKRENVIIKFKQSGTRKLS